MEMTFYDDSQSSGGKALKRPATLDLASTAASKSSKAGKRSRGEFSALLTSTSPDLNGILTTPDVNMLKMRTPEMEKLIMNMNCGLATPTPSGYAFPGGGSVTEEQENYAKGFIDALNTLHQSEASKIYVPIYLSPASSVIKGPQKNTISHPVSVRPPSVESTNSSSCSSMPTEFSVKEELQTVPSSDFSSPPCSPKPIDMADQERIKLERKRYRNRIAASKCRRRKLEKISQLEAKVNELKGENTKLEAVADKLREQVFGLKQTVIEHVKKGCQIMVHQSL